VKWVVTVVDWKIKEKSQTLKHVQKLIFKNEILIIIKQSFIQKRESPY
jgi:hypothetical protein